MRRIRHRRDGERGATVLEFALAASIFFMLLFSVSAGGVYYWTHNGLVEATRRGARYAATRSKTGANGDIRNMAVYGNVAGTGTSIVPNLTTANIAVRHSSDFGVAKGTVSVGICTAAADDEDDGGCTPYTYDFVITGLSQLDIAMPSYRTTVAGESAGYAP